MFLFKLLCGTREIKKSGIGYYKKLTMNMPLQMEFIQEVHESGVLVYLSATWLSELYQLVLSTSLLQNYSPETSDNLALINLLTGLFLH